jgi:hypothetical protein
MRQKYLITRNDDKGQLVISEYAITDRDPKQVALSNVERSNFTFQCKETYREDAILQSIAKGMDTLVASLRTPNFFPVSPYATRIAESVAALYRQSEDDSTELFFDDRDLLVEEWAPTSLAE